MPFHDSPRRPSGTTNEAAFQKRVSDRLERKLIAGPGVKIQRTARGDIITAESGRSSSIGTRYFPFKIYLSPSHDDEDEDWRTFRVRAGSVLTGGSSGGVPEGPIIPDTTDGVSNPDSSEVPDYDEGIDWIIDSGVTVFWFWLELVVSDGETLATIEGGDTPPTHWNMNYIPIGSVDTNTLADDKIAQVRQFIRTDVFVPCVNNE